MSGAVEGVARIKLDADGEAMVCTGCGTTRTVAAVVADSATAFTCCPERKMIPARTMWHAWCDANDARPCRTTPPARSYADAIEDAAKVAENMPKFQPLPDLVTPAHDEIDDWGQPTGHRFAERVQPCKRLTQSGDIAAAIRLLSQGGKA